jgi:hypothetical protein
MCSYSRLTFEKVGTVLARGIDKNKYLTFGGICVIIKG